MKMPKPLITRPNMDMPEPEPVTIAETDNKNSPGFDQIGNTSNNNSQSAQTGQDITPLDASGKWSIGFEDAPYRRLNLDLWSSSGAARIMGFGSLIEKGVENSVTAAGSISENGLRLTVKLATPEYARLGFDECDLDMSRINDTISGTYALSSAGQFLSEGNATAKKA